MLMDGYILVEIEEMFECHFVKKCARSLPLNHPSIMVKTPKVTTKHNAMMPGADECGNMLQSAITESFKKVRYGCIPQLCT